ncbi:TPA: hypothetical protein DDZ86_00515 [Candidatus Dependentiae bacterium]|nr:MAG: hypothetical protein UW09_C0002G0020 [candidate division TM6 bacterium GW2011_GWF2_43_87]HBL98111.1 hypothetical protein [Candidatus Dependentiae bacterium]
MKKLVLYLVIALPSATYLSADQTRNSGKERFLTTHPLHSLHSNGVRSLFRESPATLLYDLAYIYSASSLVFGNSVTYNRDSSLSQIISCIIAGYAAAAFSTLCHELGHAVAARFLENRSSTVYLGGSQGDSPLLTVGKNKKIIVCGLNPCRGETTIPRFSRDRQFNFKRLGVNLAGGAASILAAFTIKASVYLWHHRSNFQRWPTETLKAAYAHAFSLDPITTSGLFSMFSPFPADNDGAYWRTFLLGPS